MTIIDRAARALHEALYRIWGYDAPDWADRIATDLHEAGLLAPEPQIIRTLADLESLDPDTIMLDSVEPYTADHAVAAIYDEAYEDQVFLPAVVIATGDHVRAARQALKEATE